jgi:hypothetical protein
MKCIIAGGRDYIPNYEDWELLDRYIKHYKITTIVSGGAEGADAFGENYANKHKLDLSVFPADWKTYGPKAGPLRNRQMAEYTDYAILFPGDKGMDSMRKEMLIHGKKILYDAEDEL